MAKRDHSHGLERGFTLTELMVALTVMGVVVSALLVSYTTQNRNSADHERVVEAQEEGRLIVDTLLKDLRMAGFLVPNDAAVGSIDGGTGASDTVCMSSPDFISTTTAEAAKERYTGATTSTALVGGAASITVDSGALDVDRDGDVDFVVGGGVLVTAGDRSHCARVTAVGASSVSFTPATPGSFTAPATDVVLVPALVYELTGTRLTRSGTILSNAIEDLQVEWGVDRDINGRIEGSEFPIHDLTGEDLGLVRLARVHVTTRSSLPKPGFNGGLAAVANRNAGPTDEFKRRRVTADVVLRNVR